MYKEFSRRDFLKKTLGATIVVPFKSFLEETIESTLVKDSKEVAHELANKLCKIDPPLNSKLEMDFYANGILDKKVFEEEVTSKLTILGFDLLGRGLAKAMYFALNQEGDLILEAHPKISYNPKKDYIEGNFTVGKLGGSFKPRMLNAIRKFLPPILSTEIKEKIIWKGDHYETTSFELYEFGSGSPTYSVKINNENHKMNLFHQKKQTATYEFKTPVSFPLKTLLEYTNGINDIQNIQTGLIFGNKKNKKPQLIIQNMTFVPSGDHITINSSEETIFKYLRLPISFQQYSKENINIIHMINANEFVNYKDEITIQTIMSNTKLSLTGYKF